MLSMDKMDKNAADVDLVSPARPHNEGGGAKNNTRRIRLVGKGLEAAK